MIKQLVASTLFMGLSITSFAGDYCNYNRHCYKPYPRHSNYQPISEIDRHYHESNRRNHREHNHHRHYDYNHYYDRHSDRHYGNHHRHHNGHHKQSDSQWIDAAAAMILVGSLINNL
jgi:hypothetical protein